MKHFAIPDLSVTMAIMQLWFEDTKLVTAGHYTMWTLNTNCSTHVCRTVRHSYSSNRMADKNIYTNNTA
jgi:hypothetical protein